MKGSTEATVRIAKAALAPTTANLLPRLFLVRPPGAGLRTVPRRGEHPAARATRRPPADMLAEEQAYPVVHCASKPAGQQCAPSGHARPGRLVAVCQAVTAWYRNSSSRQGGSTGWPALLAALASGVNGWSAPADLVTKPARELTQPPR